MRQLRDFSIADFDGGINAIDLGASGSVNPAWKSIARWVNAIGFDPNAKECARLNAQPSVYHTAKFLPYAVAGETGPRPLYQTSSIYCWSLLKPRHENWLARFVHGDLFKVEGMERITAFRLDEIPELRGQAIDAMKIDTQGVELPILRAALPFVAECISIETETGFTENYEGETTFDQILDFMRGNGFGLFGLDPFHAIARKNRLAPYSSDEELLWCEAIWLRDFVRAPEALRKNLTRAKALRALCLYANHGCLSFGLEAAGLFRDLQLISGAEYDVMAGNPSWWGLPSRGERSKRLARSLLNLAPRGILGGLRRRLLGLVNVIDGVRQTPHPLRKKKLETK
jgi:hypothetical protein